MSNTTADRILGAGVAVFILICIAALFWGVVGTDKGSHVEVSLLNGTPVHVATDKQCDAMYHAELDARHTPAHRGIVQSIKDAGCPW